MTDGGEGAAGVSSGCKKVFCIDTGELYPSVTEAAKHNHISITHLTAVCKGRRKTARGLHWRYATPEDIKNYEINGNPLLSYEERQVILDKSYKNKQEEIRMGRFINSNKPVICLELDMLFPSINATALFAKVDMRAVSKSVNDHKVGVTTKAGGYHWRFADDIDIQKCNAQHIGECQMQNKFIYVFDTESRDKLLLLNYRLLKSDNKNNIYVFESQGKITFSVNDIECVHSDTLTF